MFKGNVQNPAPNTVQEPINRSEKDIGDNRAKSVRRDTDTQRDFTISLYDIDETILSHLEQMDIQVVDAGKKIKVPIFYGSPEKWTSATRDGYIRDKQGKLILPSIILKRTESADDDTLRFFNRYLNTSVIKLYSHKNQYTKFAVLSGQNAPVNDVYNIVVPSHMILTYHFIIWTELVEQMNSLVETIRFNTNDYWGTKNGFRFRTRVESYGHTVELQANEDRIVKTEFDLTTHGYILPDSFTKLEKHLMTTKKMLTPKKMIISTEIVSTDFNMVKLDKNREKWQNPIFPNLQADVPIPPPPITLVDTLSDFSIVGELIGSLKFGTLSPSVLTSDVSIPDVSSYLRVVPPPITMAALGNNGDVSYDDRYFYVYSNGWKRVAISTFS